EFERRVIASIAKVARSVEITMLIDPNSPLLSNIHQNSDELGLFFRTEETYRRLHFALTEAGVQIGPPKLLTQSFRFQQKSLHHTEKCLFGSRAAPALQSENIQLIEAP